MFKHTIKLLKLNNLFTIFRNRGGYLLSLVFLIFIFSTCGIATPVFLAPPVKLANLSFYHAYNNNPNNALGYDFIYRIYDEDIIDATTVTNDAIAYLTESRLLGLLSNNRSLFEDSYYRRAFPVDNDISTAFNDPAIPPVMLVDDDFFDENDSARQFELYFDLNLGGPEDYIELTTVNYDPNDPPDDPDPYADYSKWIRFKRNVTTDSTTFNTVSFWDLVTAQDDIPSITLNIGDTINIAFFVVLYGLTDQFVSIFSDVVFIGSESYTLQ
jgi:hypothetical protein